MRGRGRVAVVFTGGPSLKEVDPAEVVAAFGERPLVVTVKNAYDYVSVPVDYHFFNDTNLRITRKKNAETKFVFISSRYFSKCFVEADEFFRVRRYREGDRYATALDAGRLDWLTIAGNRLVSGPGIIHSGVLPWLLREGVGEIHIYGWDNMKQPAFGGHAGRAAAPRPRSSFPFIEGTARTVLKPIGEAIFLLPSILYYRAGKMIYRRPPADGEYETIFRSRQATIDWLRSQGVLLEIK